MEVQVVTKMVGDALRENMERFNKLQTGTTIRVDRPDMITQCNVDLYIEGPKSQHFIISIMEVDLSRFDK